MERIGIFNRLSPQNVLVVGDFFLDEYTIGKMERISPEAPVPILHIKSSEKRPGGAGNAALNLVSLGANVKTLGRLGNDAAGKSVLKELQKENVDTRFLFTDTSHETPVKNRIVSASQQIVRVDLETITLLSSDLTDTILEKLPEILSDVKVLAISDYGKGFLSEFLLAKLIEEARKRDIFIVADPKGHNFKKYQGVSLIKPNLSEAYAAAKLPPSSPIDQVAEAILEITDSKYLMITRSEAGISLFEKNQPRLDFPVKAKQVRDVTGAGDTVLAMLSFAIANELSLPTAIQLSNIAASIAIEQFGCARVSLSDLAKRVLEIDTFNKVFDREHLYTLKEALKKRPCKLATLPGNQLPSSETLFELISLKENAEEILIVNFDTDNVQNETLKLLTALQPVDFILLNASKDEIHSLIPSAKSDVQLMKSLFENQTVQV